ncbi:heterokaryon incompatibility protein-domain-containing protein [Paraphoma chrysanthemicola]|uniref:Heterokaryon incompatibility protein-domain-containing protein n=1 Tax=Paraphoma chrysanthemicola TaxID=798071 RepID=A0A8K0VTU7_9PLEO|nr:heterokaryon incompatibility protein-domain-containing protein [Paraphoma chrysanthemicola]
MFENLCAIPLDYELFAQAIHPHEPIVAVGLASGHVQTYRLPAGASDDSDNEKPASENGYGHIETAWRTRRHKGSCRTLGYSLDGSSLYSAGTDGIVKVADSATGQVTAKIAVPLDPANNGIDAPTLVHALSPQSLILATDSSALHIYDIRDLGAKSALKPQATHRPHDDYVSSLTPLPPTEASTSGFSKQWVTTGGSTLAVTDLRRGVMVRSEDQEEELLSSIIVTGLSKKGTSVGEKVLVGGGNGVLTLWERGVWDDQDERITVDRSKGGGESLDALTLLPEGVGPRGRIAAVGLGNGGIRFVKLGPNKVVDELKHDELSQEGVIGLGFDVTGRLISGGGKTVKVWGEKTWQDVSEDEAEDDEEEEDEAAEEIPTNGKREHESDSDKDSDEDMEESSEEEQKQKRKKRKKGKGKKQQQKDTCNCFLSWDQEALAATSTFQPATADGPSDVNGNFDEFDQAAIKQFIDSTTRPITERPDQNSAELYQPLGDGEIRVLELHAGQPGTFLHGSLHAVSVDFVHPPQTKHEQAGGSGSGLTYTRHTNHAVSLTTGKPVWYTALSYVWGVPVFDQTIQFTQKPIAITTSLATALHRLRSTQHSIFLWIDQICINQPDIKEKEQQIPLMGLIYTHATNTIIWLGDEDSQDPNLAFDIMEQIYARLQMSDLKITPQDFERLDFPPAEHRAWLAIRQLLSRPWLRRLWTIQEAVLSRNLFVKCGATAVCWDDLAAWCYVLEQCGLLQWLEEVGFSTQHDLAITDSMHPSLSGGATINSLQADRLQSLMLQEKEYLLNSLVRTRYAQATEPKDKIYGVLGITSAKITPDYSASKSARDVYHEACLTQIPELTFEILSCIDHEEPLAPSWIPDWSSPRVTEALGYSTKAWTLYQCGSRTVPTDKAFAGRPTTVSVSEDKQQLTLPGVIFDTVKELGCILSEPNLDIDNPETGNSAWASWTHLVKAACKKEDYSFPYTSVYDAFWRTLLAGRDSSGTVIPTQEHSDVFSLILDSTTGHMPSLPGQTYSPRRQKGFFTLDSLRTRKPAKTLEDLRVAFRAASTMRRFAITTKGYFALVPRGTRKGDSVVVFDKACVPFVVRRMTKKDRSNHLYQLLGETYVHGIMQGQVFDMPDLNFEDVVLV